MKKTAALIIVVMLIASLAACAPKAAPAEPDSAQTAELTDWDYISGKGEMIVGITYFEPMNYLDENGELTGFETEFTQAVCEELGVTPKFIEINWDTKEVELNAKTIDCIWNGMTITDERKENMDFSIPYIKNKQVCVIKTSNADKYKTTADMISANIVAETGSAGEEAVQEDENLKNASYTAVTYQSNALMEVKSGTADVAVLDFVMAKASVGEGTDYSDLMIVDGIELAAEEYGVGFRKNSPETVAKVNAAIKAVSDSGKLGEIAEKYDQQDVLIVN